VPRPRAIGGPPEDDEGTDPSAARVALRHAPSSFSDLAGFAEDDHAEAFRVFRRSSAAILGARSALRAGAPPSPALVSACRSARDLGALDAREARHFFETRFRPRRIVPRDGVDSGRGFLTGYYEPVVAGSPIRTEAFRAPVLAQPAHWPSADAAEKGHGGLPDRAAIEALAQHGHFEPLVWLRDPVEVFFVQVQGSALVQLPDGRSLRLVFAGRNGHPYTSIGRILVETGAIALADMSLSRLKTWIRAHGQEPGDAGTLLMQRNASYVFFRGAPGSAEGPIGGQGIALTALRSLAIDKTLYAYGLPRFAAS
jgi:membrane-bound lytic murein transglycosylase A